MMNLRKMRILATTPAVSIRLPCCRYLDSDQLLIPDTLSSTSELSSPLSHLNMWFLAFQVSADKPGLNQQPLSSHLYLTLHVEYSADTPPLSGIHIKQLSPTFTWHSFRRLSSHLYLAHILSLPFHLYMTLFFIFSADIIPPLSVALRLHLSPPLSGTFFHISRWHLLRGVSFLHPPLLVTFTLHLLPYYSTLMWHFPRASPRSISTHLNMVSFSLFLSHLYMTLILFITHRQYYSPQLLRGGFSHHFLLSTGSFSHLSLAFLQIITF